LFIVRPHPSPRPHPPDDAESDRALVERARRDPEAFGVLFERHFDAVFGYVHRRTGDWDAARDLTSEVFLKALRSLWRYRWTGVPFSSWLYAIAGNELRMHFRRGRRAPAALDALFPAGLPLADPGALLAERERAEHDEELAHEFARVRAALLRLPARYQEAIALRYFEEKSVAEVAAILGRREGTVKSLLSRGVARLRGLLQSPDATG
jgi:RNA polymerase sigma-70 factor (ECF subfamily)